MSCLKIFSLRDHPFFYGQCPRPFKINGLFLVQNVSQIECARAKTKHCRISKYNVHTHHRANSCFLELIKQFKINYTSKKAEICIFYNYCDQQVKNKPLLFSLVFARIRGKRTRAKDQKQTIYFNRPNIQIEFAHGPY